MIIRRIKKYKDTEAGEKQEKNKKKRKILPFLSDVDNSYGRLDG